VQVEVGPLSRKFYFSHKFCNLFPQYLCILYVGNVPTNIGAIEFFLSEIWSLLKIQIPNLVVNIAGGNWALKSRGKRYPQVIKEALDCRTQRKESDICAAYVNIRWLGKLSPVDLDRTLASSRVFISPIRFSTGVNTKNLLALESGLPLITTAIGGAGICHQVFNIYAHNVWFHITELCGHKQVSCLASPPFFLTKSSLDFAKSFSEVYKSESLWTEYSRFFNSCLLLLSSYYLSLSIVTKSSLFK
jgi:hypothetical protein